MTKKTSAPIPFAGSHLDQSRHVCAFFNDQEEEYRVLLPFIKNGFECGHKAIHVVNPHQREDHLLRLAGIGIDPADAQKTGQLELHINDDIYLQDHHFDQDRMIALFDQLGSGKPDARYPLSRICCRMDWATADQSRVDDLIEFESRVNNVWLQHDDVVICTYHAKQFSGNEVIDIMRTHPMVIIGGTLQHNPFYIPPDEFLREFRQRRARRNSVAA